MKKNLKKHKTSAWIKRKKQKQKAKQFLGLGPKIVNSIVIALNENDKVHAQKIVEGLSEYDKFALNIQKEIEIQKAEKVANAIRGLQLPQTMIINGSGSNSTSNTNNPVMDLINVLMVKEAKNLNK